MKRPRVNEESMRRIFTLPEDEHSTLSKIDAALSQDIHDFLKNSIVSAEKPPKDLEVAFADTDIPEDPIYVSEQMDFLMNHVVAQSVHTSSPRFVGHMTSALPYFMLTLSKLMVALNQNQVKIETSKAFTPLERQVVAMLHRLVFKEKASFYSLHTHHRITSLGTFCSGGTVANMTALWVARNRLLGPKENFDGIVERGLFAAMKAHRFEDLAILVSRRGHYSLSKAADLLGLGKQQLVAVETDEHHKIDLLDLARKIKTLQQNRTGIVAVVGVAGATETGSVDPLNDMAEIAHQEGIHFHVDAAWGGPTLFSERYANLMHGIEKADSVCFDAHKQLYIPMGAAVALFKSPEALQAIEQHANYIIRKGSRDLGRQSLEGSRPGMAMLVHSGLRIMGKKGYGLLIEQGIEKAKAFASMIEADDHFELVSHPELNILCYRLVPQEWRAELRHSPDAANRKINDLTIRLQKKQRELGQSFVSRTKFRVHAYGNQELDVLRVVLANPLTTLAILEEILNEQKSIAQALLQKSSRRPKSTAPSASPPMPPHPVARS